MANKIDRREFLALMGLGGAAATVGCGSGPDFSETWVPWVEPVAGTIPYVPDYYATTTRESGGVGLHIKVLGGRAIKAEGHPDHPINAGKLTARQQSVIQGLYGTGRLRQPWSKSSGEMTRKDASANLEDLIAQNNGRIVALTGVVTGAEAELWEKFLASVGGRHVTYEPYTDAPLVTASEKVFGRSEAPFFSLKGADCVVSLGAQFLETWGDVTANAREYAEMRTVHDHHRGTHYQVEARTSGTGANADEVLHARPGSKTMIALALLKELAGKSETLAEGDRATIDALTSGISLNRAANAAGLEEKDLEHLVDALSEAKAGIVLPAEQLELTGDSTAHHAAVLLINKVLGGIGSRVNYSASKPIAHTTNHQAIMDLVKDMNDGKVGLLLVHGSNPAYSLPASVGFAAAMGKTTSIVFADNRNETTALADYGIPVNHDLEAWGEINTYTGIDMLIQPVMRPRFQIRQVHDHLMAAMGIAEGEPANFRDFLKASWIARFGAGEADPEKLWRESVRAGGRFQMAEQGEDLPLSGNLTADLFSGVREPSPGEHTLVLMDSPRFGDGSTTDRGWLQELPETMTGLVWDSWLEMSHKTAEKLGVDYKTAYTHAKADVVAVSAGSVKQEIPIFITETIADGVVALETGQGHTGLDETYNRGNNAFAFLSGELDDAGVLKAGPQNVSISATGRTMKMSTIQLPGVGDQQVTKQTLLKEHKVERDLYQVVAAASVGGHGGGHGDHSKAYPAGHHEKVDFDSTFPLHADKNWYPDRTDDPVVVGREETFYDPYKWELAIDLNRCTGCGSCVTACYAENNLPVVGKDQVGRGREMSWLRINRYHRHVGDDHKVKTGFLPMMCQQCGNAPCESVCPSLATYHSKEGLNAMVYNRCVGTRYCANNCSYKVRRFNWFSFQWEGDLSWALNPAVTVRQKGVMEKCTFCIQRVRVAKDHARDEGREVRDGEVMTACQQACPSHAVSFGNSEDKESTVSKWAHDERAYRALDSHIHTKPGVSYLKRVVLEDESHHG